MRNYLCVLMLLVSGWSSAAENAGAAVQKIIPPIPLITPMLSSVEKLFDGAVGVCKIVPPGSVQNVNSVAYALTPVWRALALQDYKKLDKDLYQFIDQAKVSVLISPSRGILIGEGNLMNYHPNSDTPETVEDKIVFLVEVGGYKIKVVYSIHLGASGTDGEERYCPGENQWEITPADDVKPISIN